MRVFGFLIGVRADGVLRVVADLRRRVLSVRLNYRAHGIGETRKRAMLTLPSPIGAENVELRRTCATPCAAKAALI